MSALRLREEHLRWRGIAGEVIAVDLRTSTYLSANSSGALLWRALAGGASADELADLLSATFGIAREQAAADVGRFLDELAERDLLVP